MISISFSCEPSEIPILISSLMEVFQKQEAPVPLPGRPSAKVRLTDALRARIMELHDSGMSDIDVAAALHIPIVQQVQGVIMSKRLNEVRMLGMEAAKTREAPVEEAKPPEVSMPTQAEKPAKDAKTYAPGVVNGRIYDLRTKDHKSVSEIADLLNGEGIMFSEAMVRRRLAQAGVEA